MDAPDRRQLARAAAPVVVLAAATVAVLLLRPGPNKAEPEPEPGLPPPATVTTAAPPPPAPPVAPRRPARSVVIESGDTLASVAEEHGTTVDALLELNPGVDPTALAVGQRVRVP